jgi:hypothetical protein
VGVVAIPNPRYPYWITEQSSLHRGPTTAGVFARLFLILALLVALGAYGPAKAHADRQSAKTPTLCDQHHGRPGWDAVCKTNLSR